MNYKKIDLALKEFREREIITFNHTSIEENNSELISFASDIGYNEIKIIDIKNLGCTWKEVYEVTFDKAENYVPGDSIGILPPNELELTNNLINYLQIPDCKIKIRRGGRHGYQYQGTTHDFLRNYCDITSLPKKGFLNELSKFAIKANELKFLCSSEGTSEYLKLYKNRNTIYDIIASFECKIDYKNFFKNCEIIKPRFFSLTNKYSENLKIILGIIDCGQFARYIKAVNTKQITIEALKYYVKPNRLLEMPKNAIFNPFPDFSYHNLVSHQFTSNLLCICTGTGIAPFISFDLNKSIESKMWVIYGCRNKNDDLSWMVKNSEVDKTFSSNNNYVTKILEEKVEQVFEFLKAGSVYICGSLPMKKDVLNFFERIFSSEFLSTRIFCDDWR